MILRRLGNKKKISDEIQKYFPPHKIYIEPFFGAGGMFFNKPKAKYNIVNDLDSDVFNLFQVVINQKEELEKAFYMMPIHSDLLNYWKKNNETEPIKKALRFLFLSNFLLFGNNGSLRHGASGGNKSIGSKISILEDLKPTFDYLFGIDFKNWDFRKFIDKLSFINDGRNDQEKTFIYNDPPYLGTSDNYSSSFSEQDSEDLFNCLETSKCKFAMSEFDNPFILYQAKQRGLNVIIIGERQNIKNRRTEILVTNYKNNQFKLF
jgi:DNA adenine methylase